MAVTIIFTVMYFLFFNTGETWERVGVDTFEKEILDNQDASLKTFLEIDMREIPVWETYIPVYRDDKYRYPHTKVHVRSTCCGRRRSVGRDYADNCRVQLQNVFNEHAKKCDQMKFSEILSHLSNWKMASEILRNESRQRCIRYGLSSELPGSESRSCGEE